MAFNYKSLKCDCCAGTLEYSKEKEYGYVSIVEMKYGARKNTMDCIR